MRKKDPLIKQEITAIARETFCKKGYTETSMLQIAQRAHTMVGNLYTYFPNKEAILEEVIGDTSEKIDEILAAKYKEIIQDLNLSQLKAFYDMLPDCSEWFTEVDWENFIILMEKCEKSKYRHYKESLQELIYDYAKEYVSEEINQTLLELVGNMFLTKMLEHAKKQVANNPLKPSKEKLSKDELDTKERKGNDAYELKVDPIEKKIFMNVKLNPRESESVRKSFFEEYKALLNSIDTKDYILVIDCRALTNAAPYQRMQKDIEIYCYKPIHKMSLLFNERQIALAIQYKRMFSQLNFTEIEIVIK